MALAVSESYRGHRRYAHEGETVGFRTAINDIPTITSPSSFYRTRAGADAPHWPIHVLICIL